MVYNPKIHHRRSIRLKGYDYSQKGKYYITICVQNRKCLFGKTTDKKMMLNDSGKMIEKWYFELENKYPNVKCREYVVMPNHFHCIIEIMGNPRDVHGTDDPVRNAHTSDAHGGTSLRGRPFRGRPEYDGHPEKNAHSKSPYGPENKKFNASIFDMMDWFKTMTTNEYIRGVKTKNWPRFEKRLWQLRYWDRIIRDENGYKRISNYIINNPENWETDKLNN
ncbi:MAG: hypothetical protein GXO86_15585 [Chlorobi bacterium]|nr:hypothetical protein [Chlorobiota bacterium]